jgi:hypothetical protein
MTGRYQQVIEVPLPRDSAVADVYPTVNLADAFSVALPPQASGDAETLARYIFSHQPAWIGALTGMRDAMVAGLGLKTARQLHKQQSDGRVAFFKIYSRAPREIVLGEDDSHLDFRLSVRVVGESERRLVLSTVVHCHNLLGRSYLRLIRPFHRVVVKASLRSAAFAGWA